MATLSIRLDDKTKDDFAKFCDTVGMSVSTLFSVFAKRRKMRVARANENSVSRAQHYDDK